MSFNFINENYRKKHARIKTWNEEKGNNFKKLFLDEFNELEEEYKKISII